MIFERPQMLLLLLLILIPLFYVFPKIKKLNTSPNFLYKNKNATKNYIKKIQSTVYARSAFFILSWICLVIAFAGPYWGTEVVQVQKTGNAVSFVFDISWSMTAQDVLSEDSTFETRLDAAKKLAKNLLLPNKNEDTVSVSVVLAKGDGFVAVPLTEDHEAVFSVINALSPNLMTSKGSNIGAGIETAIASFPSTQARQGTIVVFTDGEETIQSLEKSLENAINHGIGVYIVGFGNSEGTSLQLGENKIVTSLKEKELQTMISNFKKKTSLFNIPLYYLHNSQGTKELLKALYPKDFNLEQTYQNGYEIKKVARHNLFILASLLFFVLGIIVSYKKIKFSKIVSTSSVFLVLMMLSSCTQNLKDSFSLLEGNIFWHQKKYQQAEMKFLQTLNSSEETQNKITEQYAIYGLGSSYVMQNEEVAALNRLESISADAPDELKFASFYNIGVLSYSLGNYEKSIQSFKDALLINPKSIHAKINLELALRQGSKSVQSSNSQIKTASESKENSVLKDAVFSIIRENEQKQWKNQEKQEDSHSPTDY